MGTVNSLEAGIDEAGRGPVIGPMVIAIVGWSNSEAEGIGVKDSKQLTPSGRSRLYKLIVSKAPCVRHVIVEPSEIDYYVNRGLLNELEAIKMSELIKACSGVTRVYVDSPDPNPSRFRGFINVKDVELIVLNHADESIPLVSAASIVAKVIRDTIISRLKETYGDFGSGYPSDPRTISALRRWINNGTLPPIVRRSWRTIKRMTNSRLF
ncbi:ribonuclease HII [Caldivirga maquilingensis]|uniref:Ribonuclease HII n=1 Tax=Caldivirga maquilingensis (strain ATCC 700844 / DSM 13496 / JCM 10307 / IC-167) TaxID=397948 RepID=RNH2_CALMQ|nr:ribonuclease HII [Caldivirga maquilingensis]A8MAH5.1 RecName: Full=Ribonuclease HII; Short=RNase HII [Caldivirga maquilingensis IC-167]ABW02552.1 ribonuclease HII [Caldivirga maquilingensis IC-167]